jgi:hypothetical protein
MAQNAIRSLVSAIKSDLVKAAQSAAKSEQYHIAAGKRLAELKAELKAKPKKERPAWADFVRAKFDLGPSRADELIRIAVGTTTVEKTRAGNTERKKRSQEKSTFRNVDAVNTASEPPMFISEFTRTDGQVKAACDYNPEDPGDVAESESDTPEMLRHRIFMHRANEALRHAREFGLEKASGLEITDDVIEAALNAAEAWSELTSKMKQLANGEKHACAA